MGKHSLLSVKRNLDNTTIILDGIRKVIMDNLHQNAKLFYQIQNIVGSSSRRSIHYILIIQDFHFADCD